MPKKNGRADKINEQILSMLIPYVGNSTTYQYQLNDMGKKLFGNAFNGVYPSDKIPRLTDEKPYAIINLDASNESGSHWVAIAKEKHAKAKNKIIVYDSFGRNTSHILPAIIKSGNGDIIDTEYDDEQEVEELNCGARCLSWLLLLEHWGEELALKL